MTRPPDARGLSRPQHVINDLGPGVTDTREIEMYMHPKTYLWLQEQDRERMLTERALQRAAREGGEQRPGMARGGISSFTSLLRRAGSAVTNIHFGSTRPTSDLSGESGI